MAPGPTGAGDLTSQLLAEKDLNQNNRLSDCHIIWGRYGYPIRRHLAEKNYLSALNALANWLKSNLIFLSGYFDRQINKDGEILLIHPQTLGFKWCTNLIQKSKDPVWLFLADSSFFCIRSYNYIPGENEPCTRCLGGNFKSFKKNNCKPYPVDDINAFNFVEEIMDFAKAQRIKFIAQNERQALLVKEHFGDGVTIQVAGLWVNDWVDVNSFGINNISKEYDIVYHGRPIAAKGVYWAIELASFLPEYRFLFPFAKQSMPIDPPENCHFKEMSWNTGLKQYVINSPLVLVPTLWSSPIEGALIKSISYGNKTAVIQNDTSFSDEIPDKVALKLNPNPQIAALQVHSALSEDDTISETEKNMFVQVFKKKNKDLLNRLVLFTSKYQY